jgi:hypothetical protein
MPPQSEQLEDVLNQFIDRIRPAEHIRPQLDVGGKVVGKTVEIFEIRPQWDNPKKVYRYPLARATWLKAKAAWKVCCQRDDHTWQEYSPKPLVASLDEFFDEVGRDRHGSFFGC